MRPNHVWRYLSWQNRLGAADRVIAFGTVKRNAQIKVMPIAAHDRDSVMQQIEAHTREGSM